MPNGKVLIAGGWGGGSGYYIYAALYDPSNGTWSSTGPMHYGRVYHTATLLPNGKVLVAGGNGGMRFSSAELYDPETGTWTETGSMLTAREMHSAVVLPDGEVLVAAGYGAGSGAGSLTTAAEIYDPETGTWRATGSMNTTRQNQTMTLLYNGKVLVAGGVPVSELYDPTTETWSVSGSLNTSRYQHTATLLPNGKVLVAGGMKSGSEYLASAELYDPATGLWTVSGSMSARGSQPTATLLPNGRVLVAGGNPGANTITYSADVYDPATGVWTPTGSMIGARYRHTATLLPNGKILAAGGYGIRAFDSNLGFLDTAEVYDVGLGFNASWQPQVAQVNPSMRLGAGLVLGGLGFRGVSEGSGGNSQNSPGGFPLVQVRSLQGDQSLFLQPTNWSDASFSSAPVNGVPFGYALATVFVNGIPSTSKVTQLLPADPSILTQPVNKVVAFGGNAEFMVRAAGTGLTYQWRFEGLPLTSCTNSTLRLTNAVLENAGRYDVIACGTFGCLTSSVASVTVLSPSVQPAAQTVSFGDNATFAVNVGGVVPSLYQWRRQGTLVAGATNATLTLTDLSGTAAGNYDVVVYHGFGSATSSVATLTVVDPRILAQPSSQTIDRGGTATFSVAAVGSGPLTYQWRKNGVPITGATESALSLVGQSGADTAGYDVVVCGSYSCITSAVAGLTVNFVDRSFDCGADNYLNCIAVQADGKILLGGYFSTLGGQARNRIGRLNADGTLDATFNPGASSSDVSCLAVQADGKIVVGGWFTTLGGQTRTRIGRLNSDGTVDGGFNSSAGSGVSCLALQRDGKILVSGYFTTLGGQTRNYLGRLNADGTLDSGFNPGANSYVYSLAVQADGKIVVGGAFTTLGGQTCNRIGRLNTDGTLDTTFDPGADSYVDVVAVQADGKILLGGAFTTLGGQTRNGFGRLNTDGTVDTSFVPNSRVTRCALQADQKIVVSGPSLPVALLNTDGTVDPAFSVTGINSTVWCLGVQADGKILIGGTFTSIGGMTRNYLGRLDNTGSATRSVLFTGSSFAWLRGGSAPEIAFPQLDIWQGGAWNNVASLTRIPGGWQGTGLGLPADATLRGRAFVPNSGSSSGIEEVYTGGPLIFTQPASQTCTFGGSVTLSVSAIGSSYQWRKQGQPIAGATNSMLRMTNLTGTASGNYDVVVCGPAGCIPSSVAALTVSDPIIVTQPTSQLVAFGSNASFSVAAVGSGQLSYQWRRDGVAVAGATSDKLSLTGNTQSGNYDVVVCGSYGCVTSSVAVLSVALADFSFNPGASYSVYSLAVQVDGKILVGGQFGILGGQTRNYLGRLNSDGTLDSGFNPGASAYVVSLGIQPDGKILVGGNFTTLAGQTCNRLGRLSVGGTLDSGFNPGPSGPLYSIAIQPDGKISVAGYFTTLGGQTRNRIGRLNADGTLDSGFNPGANSYVYSLALQADGKILVGGDFTTLGGQTRNYIGRLNADGTLDSGFNPGANSYVYSFALQADGKILVGGNFTALGGQACNRIGRLNADGTLDGGFNPGANSYVNSLVVQANGKILVGGNFTTLGGWTCNYLGRLNADGTLDSGFNAGANSYVSALMVQENGKILAGGNFTTLGGQTRNYIGRLENTDSSTQSLAFTGDSLTWLRGGGAPELSYATLDVWQGGAWTRVASLGRIAGGWRSTGLNRSPATTIRVQGYIPGGQNSGSSGLAEIISGGPSLTVNLTNLTNNAGSIATFAVKAIGGGPFTYQWFKGAMPLVEGGNVAGTSTSTLVLSNALGSDAGQYFVVVSNAFGAITSSVVSLTVVDPVILAQPASRSVPFGDTATLAVSVAGTGPISYQWRFQQVPLVGATNSTLAVTNATVAATGSYDVIVCGSYGCLTSSVAVLTVLDPAIIVQPTSQLGNAGRSITFTAGASGTDISYQWRWQGAPLQSATNASLTLSNLSTANNGNYDVVVCGRYGCVTSSVAVLTVTTVDISFNPGANSSVMSIVRQGDGKILVGGFFSVLGGQARNYLGRLNADGTVDGTFNPGAGSYVQSLAIQSDGKILVGGNFTTLGGQTRNRIARLNADGTVDGAFNPGANNAVNAIAVQADGKILVGGDFTTLGGQTRSYLGRLNADGTVDGSFNPGANSSVSCLALQAGGKILVGGYFTTLGGQTCNRIGRLNADGTVDVSFNPNANGWVGCIAVQDAGQILLGGGFSTVGGQTRSFIARLNPDGTADGFNPGANSSVLSLVPQADGKIVVGGNFTTVAGQLRPQIARVNADGTLDADFNPGANGQVQTLMLQPDGRILVGGGFNTLSGQPRSCMARLENTAPAVQSLEFTGDSLTWLFGGSAPELSFATLDIWQGGVWNNIASLARIAGGWHITGLGLSSNISIRVQGRIPGGRFNGSSGIQEVVSGGPSITAQPASRTNNHGTVATFTVSAIGGEPLSYQWFKDTAPMDDGGNGAGSGNATLTLSSLAWADAGDYFVVVTNEFGAATSHVASLTVLVPNAPPTFTVGANPTVPEDSGAQTFEGWATDITAGPAYESSQTVAFQVANDNNGLFSVAPDVNPEGTLSFTPAANANGTATVNVYLQDDGGTANGGTNVSAAQTFTITVNAVNDAPIFAKGPDAAVSQNAGMQSFVSWATVIGAGPVNEAGQVVGFMAGNDKPYMFAVQPAIAASGTLSFTPATNLRGTATVTVWAHDNGGTANGGQDTSAPQTFQITIGSAADGDGDGLPDDWAATYGLPPLPLETPARDYDGDGMSDADELVCGTNPTDASDALSITAVGPDAGHESVSVATVVGKVYRVERNDDFPSGAWNRVGADFVGTGGVVDIPDTGAATVRRGVYRVRVVQDDGDAIRVPNDAVQAENPIDVK